MKLTNNETARKYDVPFVETCKEFGKLICLHKNTFNKTIWIWRRHRTEEVFNLVLRESLDIFSKGDEIVPAPSFTELVKAMQSEDEGITLHIQRGTDKIYHYAQTYAERLLNEWE